MSDYDSLITEIAELAPLPAAYLRVRELVRDPDSDVQDLARVISSDPALTARLLRLANSAYIGLISTVDTIPRAVQVLGMNTVHDLALAGSAMQSCDRIAGASFDIYRFWRRSIYCAVLAQMIATEVGRGDPSRLFVAGLLHDVGHLILQARRKGAQAEVLQRAIQNGQALARIEREVYGYDYAELGSALLESWLLPEAIHVPVRYHVDPIANPLPEHAFETAAVHVAAILARGAVWRDESDEPVPEFNLVALALTRVDAEQTQLLLDRSAAQVASTMQSLMPQSAAQQPHKKS